MPQRPGTTIDEVLAPPQPNLGVNLSNGCFIGPTNRGPLGATLVTSWQQFVSLYGGFLTGAPTPELIYAVYLYFNTGGRQAYIIRVTDGNEVTAAVTLNDVETSGGPTTHAPRPTLSISARNPGAWGNATAIGIENGNAPDRFVLSVFSGGTTQAKLVERWIDLSMDPTDIRYVGSVINSPVTGSRFITVTDLDLLTSAGVPFAQSRPANTATAGTLIPVVLSGGMNASGAPSNDDYNAANALADTVDNPLTINYPGVTDAVLINQLLTYCENRGDAFAVIDPLSATTAAAQITRARDYTGSSGSTSYGSVYYPRVNMGDPASLSSGATRVTAPGGAILGIYAASDAANGVQKTPAGPAAIIPNAFGLETALTNSDLDALNSANVNAIRSIPGTGIAVFGGRTLTTTGKSDKYVSVRRSLIYIRAQLESLVNFAVFEPNSPLTWQQVSNVVEQFLLTFWQTKGLAGASASDAFYVICDDTNNTPATVANGELHVQVGVALQRPAEFIIIEIGQFSGVVSAVEVA